MTGRMHQLYILRAQLGVLANQVELLIATEEGAPEQVSQCPHPDEKRRDLTNMGQAPHYLCMACGEDVPGQV